jgi:stage V sporulation protein G
VEITEVRVKLMEEPGERLQAFCSITFDNAFVVRDLKIIGGASGPFVAMPSRKLTSHCPNCHCKNHLRAAYCNQCGARLKEQSAGKDEEGRAKLYADIAHPINSTCREMIQQRVIAAFEEEKQRAKLPGYVPSYDDYEDDAGPADVAAAPRAVEPAQLQGAEKPKGPHRPPARTPHAPSSAPPADSFGAGVFD